MTSLSNPGHFVTVNVEKHFLEDNDSNDNLLQHNILFVVNDRFNKLMGKMFLQEKELGNFNTKPQKSIILSTALGKKERSTIKKQLSHSSSD